MNVAPLLLLAAALAFGLSLAMTRTMLARGVGLSADVPNARSLHDRVVPRGAGAALVGATLMAWFAAHWLWFADQASLWYVGPFAAMAVLGWIDDRYGSGIGVRLAVQLVVAAAAAAALLAGIEGGALVSSLWFTGIVLTLVWVTNLYNFMDGMDGLAASQAVVVLSTLGLWFAGAGAADLSVFCWTAAAAAAAFLWFNWHPARVFMGDTGSLSLGMVIAVVSIGGVLRHDLPPLAVVIVMGVFLFDATYTLLRRMVRGERWWQSHRTHLYQRASATGLSQPCIVLCVIAIDIALAALASLLVYTDVGAIVVLPAAVVLLTVPGIAVGWRENHPHSDRSFQ